MIQITPLKSWNLTSGFGTKTVYYQCRNSLGEVDTDGGDFDSILYSPAIPSNLDIQINNGAATTTSISVV